MRVRDSECEQPQVDVCGLCALVGDVAFHHVPVAALSHGRDEVAVRPEFSAPQFLAQFGMAEEELARGHAFVEADDLSDAVFGVEGAEQVYVVEVCSQFFDVE